MLSQNHMGMQRNVRTKISTKSRLEEVSTTENPKSAYHKVLKEKGGIRCASSPSDLPRNRDQAKYARSSKDQRISHIDSLVILLTQCKREQLQHDEKSFIKEVTGAPELRCVLGYNWQIEDLITFCTDPESFSVLGVDPTFNLGLFNVTVTTFRNKKVVDKVSGHHPIMIGPLLLSQTKTFDAYIQLLFFQGRFVLIFISYLQLIRSERKASWEYENRLLF